MKKSTENRVTIAVFILIIFGFFAAMAIIPDERYSLSERRKLAEFPDFTVKSVFSGKAMEELSDYTADHFPMREEFRALKAAFTYKVYFQKDNNGIYIEDGQVSKLDFPLNPDSVKSFISKINRVYDMYFADSGQNAYFALIPDKNYYITDENGYPDMDYKKMFSMLREGLDGEISKIDLSQYLGAEDYYRTDIHWRCEKLGPAAQALCEEMGLGGADIGDERVEELDRDFYGVYYGQSALPLEPDKIRYITNEDILSSYVKDIDRGKEGGIYWGEGDEHDRYTFFLNGSSSLLTIENPNADSEKKLVIFRDSFASALAPWLVEAYGEITMVDIRYIAPEALLQFADFSGCDVLFIYSSGVVNHSETLK